MKDEEWRDLPNYEDHYQVSDLGRVKSLKHGKERILKQNLRSKYLSVGLSNGKVKSFSVHQLVVIAFLNHEPCGLKRVVNHKNFNKQDNRVENLEIVTPRENSNHKHLKSSSKYTGVSWFKRDKNWMANIRIDNKLKYLGSFKNELDAHSAYQNALNELTNNK